MRAWDLYHSLPRNRVTSLITLRVVIAVHFSACVLPSQAYMLCYDQVILGAVLYVTIATLRDYRILCK